MSRQDDILEFKKKTGIVLEERGEWLYCKGNLYLEYADISSLPNSIVVEGSLDLTLTKVTLLPENLVVGGNLSLRGTKTTSLPENLVVGGSIDLEYTDITSLPENFIVGGDLYLENTNVTSLPDDMVVMGYVYCNREIAPSYIANKTFPDILQWRNYKYVKVDGIFSEVVSHKGNVFKIKQIGEDKERYLVTDGNGKWSHGDTLKRAKEDLIYKISNRDKSAYNNLTLESELTFEEAIECYRIITGACAAGTKMFVESKPEVRKEKYTVGEIIRITEGQYGNKAFKMFFGK